MTKSDVIAAIVKLNPSAAPTFLSGFSAEDLSDYLGRLSGRPQQRDILPPALAIGRDSKDRLVLPPIECIP